MTIDATRLGDADYVEAVYRTQQLTDAAAVGLGIRRENEPEDVGSLYDFVARHNPSLVKYEHIPRLLDVGQRMSDGELLRVMILLPPRYFKTECFGRLLPAYHLRKHLDEMVGLGSYSAKLALSISEEARGYFRADGGIVSPATSAKAQWDVNAAKGGMWAAGVGGQMLGFGYHLGLLDDPTDPEKVLSPTYQKKFERWWPDKFLSRQEPNARIGVVMQRLGAFDPIDFLFRREVGEDTDEAPEHWHVVVCEEIKSDAPLGRWDGPRGLPPTCTIEPDPRKRGMVLAPSRFNDAQVAMLQRTAGTYTTEAQRQQRPSAPTGDFWHDTWFGTYDEMPRGTFNGGKDWDTAYTKEERNSASAWVESYRARGPAGKFTIFIEDCGWDWWEFPELVETMLALDGPHYIEKKASGKSAAQVLRREKVIVSEVGVKGDKLARSSAVQPTVANGRVLIKASLRRKLLSGDRQGLLRVTAEALATSRGDLDLNDAFVQAITRHTATSGSFSGNLNTGLLDDGMTQEGMNIFG